MFVSVAEFKSYFDHINSLRFEDRPDYDYLKRIFRELFFRKGFRYDNIYDWDILAMPESERQNLSVEYTTGIETIERPLPEYSNNNRMPENERNDNEQNNNAKVQSSEVMTGGGKKIDNLDIYIGRRVGK
jgi:hypothetical protein